MAFNPLQFGATPVRTAVKPASSGGFNPLNYGAVKIEEPKREGLFKSLADSGSDLITRGLEGFGKLPFVKQFATGVGNVVGAAGYGIGGAVGGLAQLEKNIYEGNSYIPSTKDVVKSAKQTAKETGEFGYSIGEQAAPISLMGGAGKIVNGLLTVGAGYGGYKELSEGYSDYKKAILTNDSRLFDQAFEKMTSGSTLLAASLMGAKGVVKSKGLIINKDLVDQLKHELNVTWRGSEEAARVANTKRAGNIYREVLKPTKGELKKYEVVKGEDINQYYDRMAQEGMIIETDPADPTKINTGKAREMNEEKVKQTQQELDAEFATKPSKTVNLREARQKTEDAINEMNLTATEKKARIADLNELYNDEVANAKLNKGNPLLQGKDANTVKSSMWRLGYRLDKPTQKATARQFGHFISDQIKSVYNDGKVTKLLEEQKLRNGITNLLENAHGKTIAGGKLAKQIAGTTGAIVGAGTKIPIIGGLLGKISGEGLYQHLTSPERLTQKAADLAGAPSRTSVFNALKGKIGLTIEDVSKTAGSAKIPKDKATIPENSGQSYYHSTKAENVSSIEQNGFTGQAREMSTKSGGKMENGVFLYDTKSNADAFGKNFSNPATIETKVDGKVYDANTQTKYGWEDNLQTQEIAKDPKIIAQLRKDGYVGVKSTELGTPATFVFEPSAVKTKSQLIDIWNKENGTAIETTGLYHTSYNKINSVTDRPMFLSHNKNQALGFHQNTLEDSGKAYTYKVNIKANIANYKDKSIKDLFKKNNINLDNYLIDLTSNPSKNEIISHPGTKLLKEKGYDGVTLSDYDSTDSQKDHDSTLLFNPKRNIYSFDNTNKANGTVPETIIKPQPYKETGKLTTKILKELEGKTTVSKQYILDATNRGELKQTEREIIRQVLETEKSNTVDVTQFAEKVKAELLPLKVKSSVIEKKNGMNYTKSEGYSPRYENISLPGDIRGKVKNYKENIYESSIKTSAGNVHFGGSTDNYFGHTRIEDMADNKTRRVIEVQSDLYQKGNLDKELSTKGNIPSVELRGVLSKADKKQWDSIIGKSFRETTSKEKEIFNELESKANKIIIDKDRERISKLQQYNDPAAHFRMVREEIKKAAEDGKTKLQFPTGETAMKIEGLGAADKWEIHGKRNPTSGFPDMKLATPENIKVGQEIARNAEEKWIITDVLGDGKFEAVSKNTQTIAWENLSKVEQKRQAELYSETFDISGKVDANNPIYKFYEKDVQKYLNKFGGKKIVDDKGVSWIEVPIREEYGKMPVEAFGKVKIGALVGGAALGTLGVAIPLLLKKENENQKSIVPEDNNTISTLPIATDTKIFKRKSGATDGDYVQQYSRQLTDKELKSNLIRFQGTNYELKPSQTDSSPNASSIGIKMTKDMVAGSRLDDREEYGTPFVPYGTIIEVPELSNRRFLVADVKNIDFNQKDMPGYQSFDFVSSDGKEFNRDMTFKVVEWGKGRSDAREKAKNSNWLNK